MAAKDKKEIKERVPYYMDNSYFEGDIEDIIKFLQKIPKDIKANTTISKDYIRYEIDSDSDSYDTYFHLYGWRLETDEEFNQRQIVNKKAKIAAENKKRDA